MFAEEWCSTSIQLKAKKLQLSNNTVTQSTDVYLMTNRNSFFISQKILFTNLNEPDSLRKVLSNR